MAFTDTWNAAFEALPPDSGEDVSLGASRIRQHKLAIRERLEVEHVFGDGSANEGEHKLVTLAKQASDPATQTDKGTVYSKDAGGGAIELYYQDESGNVTKITEGGLLVPSSIVGEIRMWSTATAPSLWLKCDGAAVSRSTYATLFALIGTTYGAGDGSTTFNLPDFRGRAPIGVGQGDTAEGGGTGTNRTLASKVGEEKHTQTIDELVAHTHPIRGRPATLNNQGTVHSGDQSPDNTDLDPTESTGGGQPFTIMGPSLTINFIIYAGA